MSRLKADALCFNHLLLRSLLNATYFSQAQTVALTVFGIAGGVVMRYHHRSKVDMIFHYALMLLISAHSLF